MGILNLKAMNKLLLLLACMMLFACKKNTESHGFTIFGESDYYTDGVYCAEISYHNPNTDTFSTYQLSVQVEDGHLVHIDWPRVGWLDDTQFEPTNITEGQCTLVSDKGNEYTVILGTKGGDCYDDGYEMQEEINEDMVDATCPKCGETKQGHEEYCDYCVSNINTKIVSKNRAMMN
jgi:hypothetical protein